MEFENMYLEKSKTIINEFLQSSERVGYKRLSGSDSEGFMYSKKIDSTDSVINFDIRLTSTGVMIFEAALGIKNIQGLFVPAMKRYCQEIIVTKYGNVRVDNIKNDILFQIDDCFRDNPVSRQTLELYEAEAIRVLTIHRENLYKLATGKVLSFTPVKPAKEQVKKGSKKNSKCEESIEAVRNYLIKISNHNAVCEKIDEDNNTLFYCHIMAKDESFRLSYNIIGDGVLEIRGSHGENAFVVPDEYRYAVSEYINDENSARKHSALSVGKPGEGVYCNIFTSLLDGTVSEETIKLLEGIVVMTLSDTSEAISTIGSGMYYKEENSTEGIELLAKMLAKRDLEKRKMSPLPSLEELRRRRPILPNLGRPFGGIPIPDMDLGGIPIPDMESGGIPMTDEDSMETGLEDLDFSSMPEDKELSMNDFLTGMENDDSEFKASVQKDFGIDMEEDNSETSDNTNE